MLKIRPILKQGICTQIYSGTTTYLWQDAWIPTIQGFGSHPLSIATPQDVTSTINDLLDQTSTGWNLDLLQLTFDAATLSAILDIQVHPTTRFDKLLWLRAKNGDFSVKSAYRLISNTTDSDSVVLSPLDWKAFWRLQIHSRHKLLFWKLLWNALPTAIRIASTISHHSTAQPDTSCPLCNTGIEDAQHLLLSCDLVKNIVEI